VLLAMLKSVLLAVFLAVLKSVLLAVFLAMLKSVLLAVFLAMLKSVLLAVFLAVLMTSTSHTTGHATDSGSGSATGCTGKYPDCKLFELSPISVQ